MPGRDVELLAGKRIVVCAPHPDDFDVVAVTLRRALGAGASVHVAVMTSGPSGVDDADFPGLDRAAKAALREAEQARSCAYFGLPPERLQFLREPAPGVVHDLIAALRPDAIFMPHPNDPNLAHQQTYATVRQCVAEQRLPATLFLNRDPKTIAMRVDLVVAFDDAEAEWKRGMLRLHASQQARNMRTRGRGFDDRILAINAAAAAAAGQAGYAEVFELQPSTGG